MATKASRPGRRLIAFGLVIAALYGGVALGGQWKPKLGLDLQGGTSITLEAKTPGGGKPPKDKLDEARGIIDQRVNGSGVAEAEVATQGDRNITVDIPGKDRTDLVNQVKQTAQLRFRLVALEAPGTPQKPSASPSAGASPSAAPSSSTSPKPSQKQTAGGASSSPTPKGRALSGGLVAADGKQAKKPSPAPSATPLTAPSAAPSAPAAPATTKQGAPVSDPLKWMDNPGDVWLKKFAAFKCTSKSSQTADLPNQPLITCDKQGNKLLLSSAMIEGTQLTRAEAGIPQNQVQWVVDLTFNSTARKTFATVTSQIANATSPLTGQQKQFAIVLDGQVISAPVVNSPIPNGQAQISGNFDQQSAQQLANSLKYGALPLKFTAPVVTNVGPTLAGDQLKAGLTAGAVGLLLVLVYCLLYYRGLGIVVLASLLVAAVVTYAVVLVMSKSAGFTLTLPGIAGLIVAVGITADSFIVYFERIRDEMRGGKSLRVAVEAGWKRARLTCLAADSVSLLAAVVLYIFSIGVVKGFAFALGISTVIDLAVFFWFTKPLVTLLAKQRFFYSGNKYSGLSPEHIGIDTIAGAPRRTAGGNA